MQLPPIRVLPARTRRPNSPCDVAAARPRKTPPPGCPLQRGRRHHAGGGAARAQGYPAAAPDLAAPALQWRRRVRGVPQGPRLSEWSRLRVHQARSLCTLWGTNTWLVPHTARGRQIPSCRTPRPVPHRASSQDRRPGGRLRAPALRRRCPRSPSGAAPAGLAPARWRPDSTASRRGPRPPRPAGAPASRSR